MSTLTTELVPQLNINKLMKAQYLVEGGTSEGTFAAKDEDPLLHLKSDLTTEDRTLNIRYQIDEAEEWMNYNIEVVAVPSNLGKGKNFNFYFKCPSGSGKLAKILYLCSNTGMFIHRTEHANRIYFPSQMYGTNDRLFANSHRNEEKLLKCFLRLRKTHYREEETKINQKIHSLVDRRILLDRLIADWTEKMVEKFDKKFN